MAHENGMTYAPRARHSERACEPGEFLFSAAHLRHGHIYGMCAGLVDAGGQIVSVYDENPDLVAEFCSRFPEAKPVADEDEILSNPDTHLIASAHVTCRRGPFGLRVQAAGKHYFSDKAPFVSLEQLGLAEESVRATGLRWYVGYSERLQNESAVLAGRLIDEGRIGKVVQVIGLGPHRLLAAKRPQWFFSRAEYGGILCDIGSHQVEQFLAYTGSTDAVVRHAVVGNYAHPEYPELEDFGEAHLAGNSGATGYFRVDWLTPDGLSTWGDGRTVILGTDGYIELRKYVDVARRQEGDNLYLVDSSGEHFIDAREKTGFPFFAALIRDVIAGTDTAMTQEHIFTAARISLEAQKWADEAGLVGFS